MKHIVVTIFLLGIVTNLQAQHVLIKKRVETPAQPVKTPTTKVRTVVVEKPIYIESNTNKFTLKLTCTASAKVLIDGEDKGTIAPGAFKKIFLSRGKYALTLMSTANSADQIKQTYEVATVDTEDLLEIDLQGIIDKRVLEEEQDKQRLITAEKEEIRQKAVAVEQEKEEIRQKAIAVEQEKEEIRQKAIAAEQEKEEIRQKAIAKALTNTLSSIEQNMVYVTGGSFDMGSSSGLSYEKPVHTVSLNSYYLGKYEVTQAQWQSLMGTNPCEFKDCPTCPVESVSWNDIQEFLQKLNEKTGKHYRLPTEAEWEYAARGGKSNAYTYSGNNNNESVAWYDAISGSKTHPVGQKLANELGIYDMSGNVWEWCSDWYSNWYGESYYSNSLKSNPTGPSNGTVRVLRGGSWCNIALFCRVAYRCGSTPEDRHNDNGFRLALVP